MKKYIKDGKVAVVLYQGFGDWEENLVVTEEQENYMRMDIDVVKAVMLRDITLLNSLVKHKFPETAPILLLPSIDWVDIGTEFFIDINYDDFSCHEPWEYINVYLPVIFKA